MGLKHYLLLIAGSLLTVSGIYLHLLDKQSDAGSVMKGLGTITLFAFIFLFYKHLKAKNETTSK